MWFKASLYLKKMSGVIMIASLIIWALNYFPREVEYSKNYDQIKSQVEQKYTHEIQSITTNSVTKDSIRNIMDIRLKSLSLQQLQERREKSFIGQIGHGIEPIIRPLGFDWKMGVSLLTGMAAKEIVVSTMGVLYQTDINNNGTANLRVKLQNATFKQGKKAGQKVYNKASAFAFMLFILFYFPCVAVIAAVRRESGGWKWAIFMAVYTTALAWIFSFAAYQVGMLF